MGDRNSSVTRVWPVFDCLFHQDPSGRSWLPRLVDMGSGRGATVKTVGGHDPGTLLPRLARFERQLPRNMQEILGAQNAGKLGHIRCAFEFDLAPAPAFLGWLLNNPQKMQWPKRSNGAPRKFGEETQRERKALLGGDPQTRDKAVAELERLGVGRSRRQWWAFEGFTSVDCLLETDRLVLVVEGKRTEPLSSATDWFPQRNQIVRNLECARYHAADSKNYAVLICAEEEVEITESVWKDSLPHISDSERAELRDHYSGCVTWSRIATEVCGGMKLPDGVDDAVDLCLQYR